MNKKKELRKKEKLNLRAMGISNRVYDKKNKKTYSVQFFDLDINGATKEELRMKINYVMSIFPYDLILYKTKHGIHFISFALLKGLRYTKAKALKLCKELKNQDYWTEQKDLTLRISPKWKGRKYKNISGKPKFLGFLKKPTTHIISNKHLEFYSKYMNLPKWVKDRYKLCDKRDYNIKIYHYKTRD